MTRPIVITGFMGCGKSSLARALARELNVRMVDLDEHITSREERSPAQIIRDEGESHFRAIEQSTLNVLLETLGASVVALGGGAWINAVNRNLIKQHGCQSIWLDTPFELCWTRIEASVEDRPLGETREQAQTLFTLRRPIYQLADIHIVVGPADNEETLSLKIRSALSRVGS